MTLVAVSPEARGQTPRFRLTLLVKLDANIPDATKAEIISELVNNWN